MKKGPVIKGAVLLVVLSMVLTLFGACGVSQTDYTALQEQLSPHSAKNYRPPAPETIITMTTT